jgi:hypothetical protein
MSPRNWGLELNRRPPFGDYLVPVGAGGNLTASAAGFTLVAWVSATKGLDPNDPAAGTTAPDREAGIIWGPRNAYALTTSAIHKRVVGYTHKEPANPGTSTVQYRSVGDVEILSDVVKVAYSWNGTVASDSLKLYVGDDPKPRAVWGPPGVPLGGPTANPFTVGDWSGNRLQGIIDEIRFYKEVLTGEEIKSLAPDGVIRPQINGHYVDRAWYRSLLADRFLPTTTSYLGDADIARKLDLRGPWTKNDPIRLEIAAALSRGDAAALKRALVSYLKARLPAWAPHVTDRRRSEPADAQHRLEEMRPDRWIKSDDDWWITFDVNGGKVRYRVGPYINWWFSGDGQPAVSTWSPWAGPLQKAYRETVDRRYAEGMLAYARRFYRDARPPIERPRSWSPGGPWQRGDDGRGHDGYMENFYRTMAHAHGVMTDDDHLMFLKMFYEDAFNCYRALEEHTMLNFEMQPITSLLGLVGHFPEFREGSLWMARVKQRLDESIRDVSLDDGGTLERSSYNFAFLGTYTRAYEELAKMPGEDRWLRAFREKMRPMFEWARWIASPDKLYPALQVGNMGEMATLLDRQEAIHCPPDGRCAHPAETARAFPQTGFLTTRSGWSPEALYMAVDYNGTPNPSPANHHELLSFAGLWAHGRVYMSNPGTPISYGHPQTGSYVIQTTAANTVVIDGKSQGRPINGGALESWQNLPMAATGGASGETDRGFHFFSMRSDAYGPPDKVIHRRGVLFIKPSYWLIVDRMQPGQGTAHEYRWMGHFQPTALKADPASKALRTSIENGKALFVVPLDAPRLDWNYSSTTPHFPEAVITTPALDQAPARGPYVEYVIGRGNARDTFATLLYPLTSVTEQTRAPALDPLPARDNGALVPEAEALGVRVTQGPRVDHLAIARHEGRMRSYGAQLVTDGEAAYVRSDVDGIYESALIGGSELRGADGGVLIKIGPKISAASFHRRGSVLHVDTRGEGPVEVVREPRDETVDFNGQPVSPSRDETRWKLGHDGGTRGAPRLGSLVSSQDRKRMYEVAVKLPVSIEALPDSVLLEWTSNIACQGASLVRRAGDASPWRRVIDPRLRNRHAIVVSWLGGPGRYEWKARCVTADGRTSESGPLSFEMLR